MQVPARAALACAALLWVGDVARAQHALNVPAVGKAGVRVDGDLGDWRGVAFKTLGDDDAGSLQYALGYDGQALYVGARVLDDELVRGKHPSAREDALVLALALPRAGGGFAGSEIWLYAGIPGEQASVAAIAAGGAAQQRIPAVKVVEGPLAGRAGYVLEARVPWNALAGAGDFMLARGAIRLHDVDGKPGARAAVHASARAERAGALPPLLCEGGPNAAIADFLRAKDLTSSSVRYDRVGDAMGDARLERVVVAGTFAAIVGPEIEGGSGFHFQDLPVTMASAVQRAELRDLSGDGKVELALHLRQQNELGARELWQVIELSSGKPRPVFALELRKETEQGHVAAELDITPGRGAAPPSIEVRIGSAQGLGPENFREQPARGVEPILLPWGDTARRVYRWDGARYAVAEQEPNRAAHAAAEPRAQAEASSQPKPEPARVVHEQPVGTAQLVAAFRAARGIDPALRPRYVQHANLAEDRRIESLMLFGKDLLVLGKGYRGGSGFFYYSLPVHDGSDIQRVFTGDVTGDGRRELFVRFKQLIGDVQREILLGYSFSEQGAQPILAVEVRRAQADRSIGNIVRLARDGDHWALQIAPGSARGWNARSYPFVAESADGYGPLLLPWKDRAVRYRFDGDQLLAGQ